MPTYDYRCDNCGHEMEAFQSITADPLQECPACGKMTLKRLIGAGAAVIFKGSGFWQTDYRSEGYKKAEKAESEAGKSQSEKGSESKSDSKKSDSAGPTTESKSAPAESKPTTPPKPSGQSDK